jgi:hypothetical protein
MVWIWFAIDLSSRPVARSRQPFPGPFLCLCEAKRQIFVAKRPTLLTKHKNLRFFETLKAWSCTLVLLRSP